MSHAQDFWDREMRGKTAVMMTTDAEVAAFYVQQFTATAKSNKKKAIPECCETEP